MKRSDQFYADEYNRDGSDDCNVGDNIADDFSDDTSLEVPLDSRPHLQCVVIGGRADLFLGSGTEGQSGWVGPTRHLCTLLLHHVYLALRYIETLRD